MNIKFTVLVCLIIGMTVFSVYAYNVRTDYNVDELQAENAKLSNKVDALVYAISIVPSEIKSEVFINSIVDKYPELEKDPDLLEKIGKSKSEEEVTEVSDSVAEETITIPMAMNSIIEDIKAD